MNALRTLPRDALASVVVFLVALPLCMGIAIASGMPPAKGLITGIIGGLVVGFLAGAPLQVSGPAAGLAVLVFELVRTQGMAALGPVLLLAGLIQLVAGRSNSFFQNDSSVGRTWKTRSHGLSGLNGDGRFASTRSS